MTTDITLIGAITTGTIAIIGALVTGIVKIIREIRKLKIATTNSLSGAHEKLNEIDKKADGNFKRMQKQLDRAEKRAVVAEKKNTDLMGIIGAVRPLLPPGDVNAAGIKTRLTDAAPETDLEADESDESEDDDQADSGS